MHLAGFFVKLDKSAADFFHQQKTDRTQYHHQKSMDNLARRLYQISLSDRLMTVTQVINTGNTQDTQNPLNPLNAKKSSNEAPTLEFGNVWFILPEDLTYAIYLGRIKPNFSYQLNIMKMM